METERKWTIYLTQDKHLDYNWCGSPAEIETRMVALVDYYLEQTEQTGSRWNLDSTIWLDVYRRHRGEAGAQRLLGAIQQGRIGYAADAAVLLWGLLSTELAIRACYDAALIAQATGTPNRTVLIMENHALPWGIATLLTESGFTYLGRGIYPLRAESYHGKREPYPLFWWVAPNGQRLLVRWDLYAETRSWGGYAEAYTLAEIAGEKWDAFHVHTFGDRNTPDVYRQRVEFIHQTIARYAAYGDTYPISSILLLGTGWDNWTLTGDYAAFIRQFNAEFADTIELLDARYEDFFDAALREIETRGLDIPTLAGSFGICWEEWSAHLAQPAADFREAERRLRLAEAQYALSVMDGTAKPADGQAIRQAYSALLRFAEHDFGGCNRTTAAISAGVRAAMASEALSVAQPLSTGVEAAPAAILSDPEPETLDFAWQGRRVLFDPEHCGATSLVDASGQQWVPQHTGVALGEFIHARYSSEKHTASVFPPVIPSTPDSRLDVITCRRGAQGIEIQTCGERWGFGFATRWLFHAAHPWIDVQYDLEDGWSEEPQAVQFCFPLALDAPTYRYDMAGAILIAGPTARGGHDLPGANPDLFAAQTFAAAHSERAGAILLTPDAPLVQFGASSIQAANVPVEQIPAALLSMPMMNLTRNDWQFAQGGLRRWRFRYRLILVEHATGRADAYTPLQPIHAAQQFGAPPYLQVPGQTPVLPGSEKLGLSFAGGPVITFKVAEDGARLIVRLWNVLEYPVEGMLTLPSGYTHAQRCNALEQAQEELPAQQGKVTFEVGAQTVATLALCSVSY